jgi:hypothetical protein
MREERGPQMFVARVVQKCVKMALYVLLACVLGGFVVMGLWNWLMPVLFGLHAITFWQALGLLVLSKILLGGFHKHGGRGGRGWRRGGRERWAQMSPEERERFRAGMRGGRCGPNGGDKEAFREEMRNRWGRGPYESSDRGAGPKEAV